jgi:SMC interacting uncharacterized protein involved in chromosome segregation
MSYKKLKERKAMNEKEMVQDAQLVEKAALHKDTVALDALRKKVTDSKEDFKKQLAQVKEAIEIREEEIKNLTIKKHKLQGAVEASDIYLQQPASK